MIFNPYALLGLLVAFLITFGTGYHNGYKRANDHAEALKLQAVIKAQKQAAEQARKDAQIAQSYEIERETVRTIYVKVKEKARENIEKHPEYADCSLDPDGLRLYNARPGTAEDTTAILDGRVSGSASGTGWPVVDDSVQQPGALATVLRLPGAPQIVVGMGDLARAGKTETIAPVADAP
ncbi:MAG: hypothetical protein JNL77_08875 [Nitrosomonas sp.]|nr:hypothetical protein [Nitrosomonas sp.]